MKDELLRAASEATDLLRSLAHQGARPRQALAGGEALFAVVRRGECSPELATAVFDAAVGEVVGPVHGDGGYAIVRVLELSPARLDGPTRLAVERRLFEAWLEERRTAARIEWYWGNVVQTAAAA